MIEVVIFKKKESSVLKSDKAYVKHIYAFDGNIEDKPYSEKFADDLYASFFFNGDIREVVGNPNMPKILENLFNIYNNQIVKHRNDQAFLRGSSVVNHAGRYRDTQEIYPMYIMALDTSDSIYANPQSTTGVGLIKMCNDRVVTLPNSIYVSPTSKYYKKPRIDRQSNKLQLVSISYDEKFAKAVFFSREKGTQVVIGAINVDNVIAAFNVFGKNVMVNLRSATYDII